MIQHLEMVLGIMGFNDYDTCSFFPVYRLVIIFLLLWAISKQVVQYCPRRYTVRSPKGQKYYSTEGIVVKRLNDGVVCCEQ